MKKIDINQEIIRYNNDINQVRIDILQMQKQYLYTSSAFISILTLLLSGLIYEISKTNNTLLSHSNAIQALSVENASTNAYLASKPTIGWLDYFYDNPYTTVGVITIGALYMSYYIIIPMIGNPIVLESVQKSTQAIVDTNKDLIVVAQKSLSTNDITTSRLMANHFDTLIEKLNRVDDKIHILQLINEKLDALLKNANVGNELIEKCVSTDLTCAVVSNTELITSISSLL